MYSNALDFQIVALKTFPWFWKSKHENLLLSLYAGVFGSFLRALNLKKKSFDTADQDQMEIQWL